MDSATPTLPMPPQPGVSAFVPPAPQSFAQPTQPAPQAIASMPAQRPVGRPNGDPEVQEARQERAQLKQRLRNILPKSMVDGRIAIYRLQGRKGKVRASAKPCMSILFQDLEKCVEDGTYKDTGEMVEDRLIEKYGESGRFLWEAQDNRGRAIPEAGEAEIDLSDGADDTNPEGDDVDDENENDTDRRLDDLEQDRDRERPMFHAAPPPPAFDPAVHARQVKEIVQEEKKSAEGMVTVLMTMMQAQNQQNMQAMQLQVQQAEARRQEEDRRREREETKEREERKMELERLRLDQDRRDKEEARRDEREKDRRVQEQQMQMTLMQAMFNRPDTTTPMLMKMIESKGDRDGMKDMFGLMSEASKQAMSTQAEGTRHMLSAQAEASKSIINNVMGLSQTMMQNVLEQQAEPSDDPMEKIGRIFKMIAPALNSATSAPQMPPTQQQQAIQHQPSVQQQPQVPPAEWIKGGLYTIMKLETGEIPIAKRFHALKWCADNLPKPMLDAIRSGIEDNVMEIGAAGMDANIIGWISDDKHAQFLRDCIADIQRMLLGALTQTEAKASFEKHLAYMQAKGQPAPAQAPAQAAPATEAEQMVPADMNPADVAQPVASPTPGKRYAPPAQPDGLSAKPAPQAEAPPAEPPQAAEVAGAN